MAPGPRRSHLHLADTSTRSLFLFSGSLWVFFLHHLFVEEVGQSVLADCVPEVSLARPSVSLFHELLDTEAWQGPACRMDARCLVASAGSQRCPSWSVPRKSRLSPPLPARPSPSQVALSQSGLQVVPPLSSHCQWLVLVVLLRDHQMRTHQCPAPSLRLRVLGTPGPLELRMVTPSAV